MEESKSKDDKVGTSKQIISVLKPLVSVGAIVAAINYFLIPIEFWDEWIKSPIPQAELVTRALSVDPKSTEQEMNKLEKENELINSEARALEIQKTIFLGQIDDLKTQLAQLREENQGMIRDLGSKEAQIETLKEQVSTLTTQLADGREQHDSAKRQLRATKSALAKAKAIKKDEFGFVLNKKSSRICRTVELSPPSVIQESTACSGSTCMSSGGYTVPGVYSEECYMGGEIWAVPPKT